MSEIERVLATLDSYANGADAYCMVSQEAARLLRALAADFEKLDRLHARGNLFLNEVAWIDAASARWRLPKASLLPIGSLLA